MSPTAQAYQLLPALDADQRDSLRQSIEADGILQPIEVDEDGRILDGHHRSTIAAELGIDCPSRVIPNLDENGKRRYALTVNLMRRQLGKDARGKLIAQLAAEGMSVRAIAAETGLTKSTVANDISQLSKSGQLDRPDKVTGLDGRERPATQAKPAPSKPPEQPAPATPPAESEAIAPVDADGWDEPGIAAQEASAADEKSGMAATPTTTPEPLCGAGAATAPTSEATPVDEEDAVRRSRMFIEDLVGLFVALDPSPIGWLERNWRPVPFSSRHLPLARDAFTPEGLRSLAGHLHTLADHLDQNGISL